MGIATHVLAALLSAGGEAVVAVAAVVVVDLAASVAEGEVLAGEELAQAGKLMRTHEFLSHLNHDRIVTAIQNAEAKTSGQIRVYLQRGKLEGDAVKAAQKQFHRLQMQQTTERNGVLIFVAPRARKFAVIGDQGVHQKCGDEFWQRLVDSMRAHFQKENFTDALVEAIDEAGKLLAQYFPRASSSQNELADDVVEG